MATQPFVLTYGEVNKSTIGLLKIIHRELLPVHYTEKIYNYILGANNVKGELIFCNSDTAVGEICYRKEEEDGQKKIYIMTIGVLKTYQKHGIGTKLIEHVIEQSNDCDLIYLHVHVDNIEAQQFYEKKGFTKGDLVPGYYKSLEKGDAFIYSKKLKE